MNKTIKPMMTNNEIRIIEKTLFDYGKSDRVVNVLEWGSGGSTVYFTKYMRGKSIEYSWDSVEYNRSWYEKIRDLTKNDKSINIALFDVGNNGLKQINTNMDKYVEYPESLGKKFDVVLVDGRKRRRCLIEAKKLIRPNGVVFLHDAQRKYYHSSFELYSNHRFVSVNLWMGDNLTKSAIVYFLYRVTDIFYEFYFKLILNPAREILHFVGRIIRGFKK
jgi:hypothetical protein